MRHKLVSAIAVVVALVFVGVGLPASAEEDFDPAAMAKLLPQASVSLEQGLRTSEKFGSPISAKFEIERGALQLSIYVIKGGQFSEVIVNHVLGSIKSSKSITDADDLKEAQSQSAAMDNGWVGLDTALANVIAANPGYRAISIEPVLKDGRAFATIILMKGQDFRKASEALY